MGVMLIFGYIISNGDEAPVLPDAIDSLASFCDRIFLVDGGLGGGTLNHHPEHTNSIGSWLLKNGHMITRDYSSGEYLGGSWKGCWLTLWEHPFQDPAAQ